VSAPPTVLVVDADPDARRLVADALPADAWRVVSAANAEAAMQRLAEERVRVLVVEIALPGPSGLLVLEEARRAHPHAARVVVTAASELDVALQAINEAEVFRFLRKPVTASDLRAAVGAGLAWSESARVAEGARAAAARRSAGLAALAAEHPDVVPVAAGAEGYGIPPHRVAVLAQRLAGTPLGTILAATQPPDRA
jgi:two-component system, probable response regulator PhcQ